MQKKKLTNILTVIVLIILAYQFLTGEESSDVTPVPDEIATVVQTADEMDAPTEVSSQPQNDTAPAEDVPTESVAPAENPLAGLEEADGDFDYWVMALSWSPDYCASNDYQDVQQCSIGKQLDFVLHGLWPQYDKGYPSFCSDEKLTYDLKVDYAGLYPNDNLFDHEWEKHGTCTGLTPEGYLEWSETLKTSLVIPTAFDSPLEPFRSDAKSLSAEFIAVNPTFTEDSFAVYCSGSGRFLQEIFVCYEKDGQPTDCSPEVLSKAAKSCGQQDFLVRNTR